MVKILAFDTETNTMLIREKNSKKLLSFADYKNNNSLWSTYINICPSIIQLSYILYDTNNSSSAKIFNKYIDIPELLTQTSFDITIPNVIPVNTVGDQFYPSASSDFSLHRIRLFSGEQKLLKFAGPSIFLVMEGEASWMGESSISTKGVAAFFVEPNEPITIKAYTEVELFIATVPI